MNDQVRYTHTEVIHNLVSPKIIVPVLFQWFQPKSVVDIGCGIGTFLKIFKDLSVTEILGVDGPWVDRSKLYISDQEFMVADLEKPIMLPKTFDLVLSLEVAEHLSPEASETFVDSLVSLGKIIIFSAAIPNQGGQNHLNEQNHSYWQEKFEKRGYRFVDVCRQRFWNEREVKWWYKQNMFVVVHNGIDTEQIERESKNSREILTYIHPDLYNLQLDAYQGGKLSFWFYWKIVVQKLKERVIKKQAKEI